MLVKRNRFFTALRNRKFDYIEVKKDARNLGLVFVGGGVIAIILQTNWLGVFPALFGVALLYFGLTEPKEEDRSD